VEPVNRIIHFEIQADDPGRAAQFYRDVFGWEIREWVMPGIEMKDENRYWFVITGPETDPGINGGLVFRRGSPPVEGQAVNAYVCTIGVPDLDRSVGLVRKAGGNIILPRMGIPGIGWWAHCRDTEGNLFGMLQEDPNAS